MPINSFFFASTLINREQTEAKRAHQALDRLYQLFTASGFAPCRLDIDYAHWADQLRPDTAARRLIHRLKEMIDPNHVIAPGRYHCPTAQAKCSDQRSPALDSVLESGTKWGRQARAGAPHRDALPARRVPPVINISWGGDHSGLGALPVRR